MTLTDWELWAVAQKVVGMGEPAGNRFITERIDQLATAGDEAGVRAWKLIAIRVDQLRDFKGAHGRRPHWTGNGGAPNLTYDRLTRQPTEFMR